MNGRKLFREYFKSKGYDVKSFVKIESSFGSPDTFIYKDSKDNTQNVTIDYRDMLHWTIKNTEFKKISMENKFKIQHFIDSTYQVIELNKLVEGQSWDGWDDHYKDEVVFQGTLTDCEAWISLKERNYI